MAPGLEAPTKSTLSRQVSSWVLPYRLARWSLIPEWVIGHTVLVSAFDP